jgi:hypothetical protein
MSSEPTPPRSWLGLDIFIESQRNLLRPNITRQNRVDIWLTQLLYVLLVLLVLILGGRGALGFAHRGQSSEGAQSPLTTFEASPASARPNS